MKLAPKIQISTDYDSFQFCIEQRTIRQSHVYKLMQDKTFPEKFFTSPIIVNNNREIIDGQHRFLAAKELEIPIYFIQDPTATLDDIRNRNTNVAPWKGREYIEFYSKTKKSFKILKNLLSEYKVSLSFINSAIIKLCKFQNESYTYSLKHGTLDIEKYENDISKFLSIYVPTIKECREIRGKIDTIPLFLDSYIQAFAYFFREDKKVFERAIDRVIKCGIEFPYLSSHERGRQVVLKISRWTPKNFKIKND